MEFCLFDIVLPFGFLLKLSVKRLHFQFVEFNQKGKYRLIRAKTNARFHMNESFECFDYCKLWAKKKMIPFSLFEPLQFLNVSKIFLRCLVSKECCFFHWISFDWRHKDNEILLKYSNVQWANKQYFLWSKTISVNSFKVHTN